MPAPTPPVPVAARPRRRARPPTLVALGLWACCAAGVGAGAGLAGCGTLPRPRAPAPETWWTPDSATEGLLEADRAFAALSARAGVVAAFRGYAAPDVVDLPANGAATATADALVARLAGIGTDVMTWEVERAEVSQSGETGFTYGIWRRHRYLADGPLVGQGRYLTVWRRQHDGRWRATVDIANSDASRAAFPPLAPGRLHLRLDAQSQPGDPG